MASGTFLSPYDQYSERNGQRFEVVRAITEDDDEHEISEVGPMYVIRFEDGDVIEAWPEEIESAIGPQRTDVGGAS